VTQIPPTPVVSIVDQGVIANANQVNYGYCALADLKADLSIPAADTTRDTALNLAITAASRAIDHVAHRSFYMLEQPTVRLFYAESYWELLLRGNDIATTANLLLQTDSSDTGTFDQTWVNGTDYILEPYNGLSNGEPWPYTRIRCISNSLLFPIWGRRPRVQITAHWGWPAIPAPIEQACRLWAARIFKRREAPFGVISVGEFGPLRLQSDPDIDELIVPYMLAEGFA